MAFFFAMPGNEQLANDLADLTAGEVGNLQLRKFPDGETYVRILSEVTGEDVFVVCTLFHPDKQFLPLIFATRAIRGSGAKNLTLIAPYLGYLRQDRQFHAGEAVSSRIFADLLNRECDALVTVDPHLHRYRALSEIYSVPTTVVHLAQTIGAWVSDAVASPVVIGPDEESAQWVEEVAGVAGCPWTVFKKERRGDRDVRLQLPDAGDFAHCTPLLVDDIISSGATIIGAAKLLRDLGFQPGFCIAVHALFDEAVSTELLSMFQGVVTSDTVPNPFSRFQVAPPIANAIVETLTR